MSSIAHSPATIQTSSQSVPSTLCWFDDVTVIAHILKHQDMLLALGEQVRDMVNMIGGINHSNSYNGYLMTNIAESNDRRHEGSRPIL